MTALTSVRRAALHSAIIDIRLQLAAVHAPGTLDLPFFIRRHFAYCIGASRAFLQGSMMENTSGSQTLHRWYTRPVFFVADVNRAARFYVEMLGFEKGWHTGDGAGKVCQVNHGECEIILCEDATRRDRGRLFIELTSEGLADLRREFVERAVPTKETWWGYDTLQVDDPDGNELLFPRPD